MEIEKLNTAICNAVKAGKAGDLPALVDAFEMTRVLEHDAFQTAHAHAAAIRRLTAQAVKNGSGVQALDLNKRTLLFDAPYDLDCYMRYIEWNRDKHKRFYEPRRKQLKQVVDALQLVAEDKLDLLAVSMPPGAGKTTTAIFALTWFAGRQPQKPILSGSHSNSFLRGMYDELLRVLDKNGEYLFHDVFPRVNVIGTNAKDMLIDLGETKRDAKRFATFELSSIGSGNAGKVRAENLLYCDDLCSGIEEALSKERLDKLWQSYATDLRQRKIGACKEIHVATRWSLYDPIGRLQTQFGGSPRAKFIVMPALDENDQSNFDYPCDAGFTTEFYHQQREVMDNASWKALYMNQPIEREGQLYNEDELRRYFELPDKAPDAILAVCDTKDKGSDYCAMPIVYQYGQDFYLEDMVFDNGDPSVVETLLWMKLCEHNVQMAQFESNAAGGKIAEKVQELVKEHNGRAKITTKYTTANKETKILVNSPWVKEHMLFKDRSTIKHNKAYRCFLDAVTTYTLAGKNKHDDAPDSLAQFAEYVMLLEGGIIEVFKRPY